MKIDTLHSSTILVSSFWAVILLGTGLLMLPLSPLGGFGTSDLRWQL